MSCKDVYCGFWVNWEQGGALGSRYTVPKSSGLVLVAFSVILIGLGGTHLWGIICYTAHQLRATPVDEDDVHHQIQIVLRNASTGWNILSGLFKIAWSRRRTSSAVALRALPLVLMSIVYISALAAASLFSSRAIIASDAVLTRGTSCGWQGEFPEDAQLQTAQNFTTTNSLIVSSRFSLQKSAAYAGACYGPDVDPTSCDLYVQRDINSTTDFNAPCPFAAGVCATAAVSTDSGLIHSDQHLGVNSHLKDRVSFRKITTCAPLSVERYTDNITTTEGSFVGYAFGETLENDPSDPLTQYTFLASNSTATTTSTDDMDYNMSVANYFPSNASVTTFNPIQDLNPGDEGDISLVSLKNTLSYIQPVHDPWFLAGNPTQAGFGVNSSFYAATNRFSILGCVEKYQVCIGGPIGTCSGFTGFYNIPNGNLTIPSAIQNPMQNAIFGIMWKAIWASQVKYLVVLLNKNLLLANNYLWGYFKGVSAPLPDNQWQSEVVNMHNTSMASFQRRIVEYASPPNTQVSPGISSISNIAPPNSTAALELCSQIKVRNAAYTSFSVFGFILLVVLTILVVTINLTIQSTVDTARKRWNVHPYKSFEWTETSAMQLHRMACEGRGIGPWNGKTDVPRTQEVGSKFSLTALSLREMFSSPASDEKQAGHDEMEMSPEYN